MAEYGKMLVENKSRLDTLEVAVFQADKKKTAFDEFGDKIQSKLYKDDSDSFSLEISIEVKACEQRCNQKITNHGKEISDLIFRFKNNVNEFQFVKEQAKRSMDQFLEMQNETVKSKIELKTMFDNQAKKNYEDFVKFNDKQSELQKIIDVRLSQLDKCKINISKNESIIKDITDELKEMNDFLFDLQNNKVAKSTFDEQSIDQYSDIRKMNIQVDNLTIEMKALGNFCQKYVPLQTQNAISKTLHGYISPYQKTKLQDYEVDIYSKLYDIILKDDGNTDLTKEKEDISMEINTKLAELKTAYKERHLSYSNVKNNDNDGEGNDPDPEPDQEDMVDIFKKQIAEINRSLDMLPTKFRKIDETLEQNLIQSQKAAEDKVRQVEEYAHQINNELDNHSEKLSNDKKLMSDKVELNQKMIEVFKEDYVTKSNVIKSLSGVTACLLEATCIKAFLDDALLEEHETAVVKKSQLSNFAIKNSFPSLIRDPTQKTVPSQNKDLNDSLMGLKRHYQSIDLHQSPYQEVYVYRDVSKEVAESTYYKLITASTKIFNKNKEFMKMGYDLKSVFERTLPKKKAKGGKDSLNRKETLQFDIKTEDSEYSEVESKQMYSSKHKKDSQKKGLHRKFNNSTLNSKNYLF